MSDGIVTLYGKKFSEHLADREKTLADVERENRHGNATYLKIAQDELEDINEYIDRMISGDCDE